MSRCFPFPPPGYEKKIRTDDADLLTKEKQKEEKLKKEKRDKEKKAGKEKKDQDRSKEKHREKKDRKEKHKDKKDKDRDKDKNRTSDQKRIEGQPEGYNGEKLGHNNQRVAETKDSKFVQELDRRIRNDQREMGNQMVENFAGTDQRRAEDMGRLLGKDSDNWSEGKEKSKDKRGNDRKEDGQRNRDEERGQRNAVVQNFIGVGQRRVKGTAKPMEKDAEKSMEKNEKNKDNEVGDKFVQELGRRIRDDGRETGNRMVEKFIGTDQRRAEGMGRLLEKSIGIWTEGGEKNKDKGGNDKRADGQRNKDGERGMGNEMVQNIIGMDQNRVEGMVKTMEKDAGKRLERKEKSKDKEGGNKHKDRDREKKSKGKDKNRDKEKKKEKEKVKEKGEHNNKAHDKVRQIGEKDPIDALNIKSSQLPEVSEKSAATKDNLAKRKGFEINGFLNDNDARPNKLPRSVSSTHLLTKNGRTLEPCQTAIQFSSNLQGTANNHKLNNKENKVNGVIEVHPSFGSTRPSFTTVQANENGEASAKPPHPDSKYLSQILSVPKTEESADYDDNEWLFSCDNIQSKKPKAVFTGVDETPQVWAEALQMASADVCALPYVIPY